MPTDNTKKEDVPPQTGVPDPVTTEHEDPFAGVTFTEDDVREIEASGLTLSDVIREIEAMGE